MLGSPESSTRATDDIEVVHVAFGQTARDPQEFRQFMEARRRCPPTERWRSPPVLYEEGVTNENLFRGAHTGPSASLMGVIEPTGRSFGLPSVEVWYEKVKSVGIFTHVDSATLL